ncbi:hypothetical protein CLIB1444_13S01244 [[Candida] jaroonii]|uniref:Uncharacterized protein n=1 Tax=[Candida] jaroonii TaxID=467808 RepID=A0ACA9YDI7_9ASCO|nr:hypothetical protein CLIB1444_13S01244 [[Candida] jaroonii]
MSKRSQPEEDVVIPLDSKKQVTVRKFNNINLVDIREFYVDKASGEKKPGKKGISLTEEVWKNLIENKDVIQEALDNLNGGKKARIEEADKEDKPSNKAKKEPKSKEFVEESEEE